MKNGLKTTIAALSLVAVGSALAGWSGLANGQGNIAGAGLSGADTAMRSRTYEVDPVHTNVIFKIRHGSVSNFYGRFNETQGTIEFDKLHVERSSMSFTVQTGSVDTHNRTRDGHIKGADFFNARQFPEITFASTGITELSDGVYTLTGDLTLMGKTVRIDAQMLDVRTGKFRDNDVVGLEARFTIKRSDFGITKFLDAKNPEKGPLGDVVELIVGVEADLEAG